MDLSKIPQKLIGDDERAVSPVIGVVLMVAVTVILASVIAAFVLGLSPGASDEPQAGIEIDGNGTDTIELSMISSNNADGIAAIPEDDTYSTEIVTITGNSVEVDYESGASDHGFTVVAFQGDEPEDDDSLSEVDEDDGTTIVVIDDFELDS